MQRAFFLIIASITDKLSMAKILITSLTELSFGTLIAQFTSSEINIRSRYFQEQIWITIAAERNRAAKLTMRCRTIA